MTPARGVALARILDGVALLGAAPAVASAVTRRRPDRVELAVIRILAARHLAQGTISWFLPPRVAVGLGVAVDGTHAATMIGWGTLDRRHRRLALGSALAATAFALTDSGARRRVRPLTAPSAETAAPGPPGPAGRRQTRTP